MANKTISLWHPGNLTPPVDWDYPLDGYVSKRVVAEWVWEYNENLETELRFAKYYWGTPGHWMIEGVTGNTIVKRWFDPQEIQ